MAPGSGRGRSSIWLILERRGLSKGLFGGKRGWLYFGTMLFTVRTVRRFVGRRTEILLSEELKPGQRLIISNDRPTLDGVEVGLSKGRRGRR